VFGNRYNVAVNLEELQTQICRKSEENVNKLEMSSTTSIIKKNVYIQYLNGLVSPEAQQYRAGKDRRVEHN